MKKDISKITINHLLGHDNKEIREQAKKIKEYYDRIFHNNDYSLTVTLNQLGKEYKNLVEFIENEDDNKNKK